MKTEDDAIQFAIKAHGDQKYGDVAYVEHLKDVRAAVERFRDSIPAETFEIIAYAAWLHDTIEDTPVEFDDVVEMFGLEIADCVWAVTDEPAPNRRQRAAKTLPKIKAHPFAIYLKLCDRIANVEATIRDRNKRLFKMYSGEYEMFRGALSDPHVAAPLWSHLDRLMSTGISAD